MPCFGSLGFLLDCFGHTNFFACVFVSFDLIRIYYKTLNDVYIRGEGLLECLSPSVHGWMVTIICCSRQ